MQFKFFRFWDSTNGKLCSYCCLTDPLYFAVLQVTPEVKPAKGEAGSYTNKMHYIKKSMLSKMRKKKYARSIVSIDRQTNNVSDCIRKPIDLGIIMLRLKNRYYRDVNQLVDDIRLLMNNCKLFNSNNSAALRKLKKLEKRFNRVLLKVAAVEEMPYHKKESDKGMVRKQCKQKVKKLQICAEQLEPEACEFFQEKWMELSRKLHKRQLKSLENLNAHVNGFLNQCNNQAKHIYELFRKDLEEYGYENDVYGAALATSNSMWQCGKTKFKWQDCLIDGIDDIIASLNQNLHACCSKQQAGGEQEKQTVAENEATDGKEKQSFYNALLQMFVHAQIINEGLCGQTNLEESSDDEDTPAQSNYVNEEERLALQKQFDQLPPESMYEVMHLIEQAEYCSQSNRDRKYNVMYFSRDTINLIKKAIDRTMRVQNKAQKDSKSPNLSDNSAYDISMSQVGTTGYYQYPYPTSSTLAHMDEQCSDDVTMENFRTNKYHQYQGDYQYEKRQKFDHDDDGQDISFDTPPYRQ